MSEYIIYYTSENNTFERFEVTGCKAVKEAVKNLRKEGATDIITYKRGKDFLNNQDDVIQLKY